MAKTNAAASASAFLQKATALPKEKTAFKESFEVTRPAAMSGFKGMFGDAKLSTQEETRLQQILDNYYEPGSIEAEQLSEDFLALSKITSEVKAISNQSILLHGERIKRAQDLLKNYQDGAFTEWLLATYGNRQTPYSMLQYYEFYHSLPAQERLLIEGMPKKAAYTLAARDGSLDSKLDILRSYRGENQKELILLIQERFPRPVHDRRRKSSNESAIQEIGKLVDRLEKRHAWLTAADIRRLADLSRRLAKLTKE